MHIIILIRKISCYGYLVGTPIIRKSDFQLTQYYLLRGERADR